MFTVEITAQERTTITAIIKLRMLKINDMRHEAATRAIEAEGRSDTKQAKMLNEIADEHDTSLRIMQGIIEKFSLKSLGEDMLCTRTA